MVMIILWVLVSAFVIWDNFLSVLGFEFYIISISISVSVTSV